MRVRVKMRGDQIITTHDDDGERILEEHFEPHAGPGASKADERRRKLIGSLPVDRFDIHRDGAMWRIWGTTDEEPAAALGGPGAALAAALRGASNDAAARTDDADDRRVAADASLPMPKRIAALGRINARRRHDLR